MPINRVKQFYLGITSKLNSNDHQYLKIHLTDDEISIFNRLTTYEKKHSINVARDVEKVCASKGINNELLIKAALLHDIGKVYKPVGIINKSAMVVLDNISGGRLRRFSNIKSIDVYYNHGEKGYNLLKNHGYNDRLLYLIRNHHNNKIDNDIELNILRECDDNN
ncbi:MAG: HDIG domain-containing protein [Bacillota bacterium]|nr:HDIG domain-containing protein [Bacillota bacterium]